MRPVDLWFQMLVSICFFFLLRMIKVTQFCICFFLLFYARFDTIQHRISCSNPFLIQCVCIWEWMDETERPLWCTELNPKHGFQVSQHIIMCDLTSWMYSLWDYWFSCWVYFQGNIIFNPNDNTQLLSSSESHVLFYNTVSPILHFYWHTLCDILLSQLIVQLFSGSETSASLCSGP